LHLLLSAENNRPLTSEYSPYNSATAQVGPGTATNLRTPSIAILLASTPSIIWNFN
jgi:hypothetical protein